MAANHTRSNSGNSWEELSVPPEIALGNPSTASELREESINMDSVEIAEEATPKMKVRSPLKNS